MMLLQTIKDQLNEVEVNIDDVCAGPALFSQSLHKLAHS